MPTEKEKAAEKERRAKDQDKALEDALVNDKLPEADRRAAEVRANDKETRARDNETKVDENTGADLDKLKGKTLPRPPAVVRHTGPQMVIKSDEPLTGDVPTDALMALPVGSIIERVDGGVHVKRRDGNGFHSGYGRTLQDALDDIRGVSVEERRARGEKSEDERRRREKVNTGDLPKAALTDPSQDPSHEATESVKKQVAKEQAGETDTSTEGETDADESESESKAAKAKREKVPA